MRTVVTLVFVLSLALGGPVRAQVAPDSPTEALFDSVIANDLAGVQASLDAGADVFARDRYGNTAADVAVDRGHFDIAHYLLGVIQRQRERARQEAAEATAVPPSAPVAPVPALPPPAVPLPGGASASPSTSQISAQTPPQPAPFTGPSPFDVAVPRASLPAVPSAPAVSAPAPTSVSMPELAPAPPAPEIAPPVRQEPVSAAAEPVPAVVPQAPDQEAATLEEAMSPDTAVETPAAAPVIAAPSEAPQTQLEVPQAEEAQTPQAQTPPQGDGAGANSFMSDFLNFILPDKAQPVPAVEATGEPVQQATPDAPPSAPPVPETRRTFGAVLGLELGTARSAQHFQTQTSCTQKSPALAVCIEPVAWPEGVLAHDADIESGVYRRTVGDRRLRAVVGYEDGAAAYVHTIVSAADFDAAVAHLSALFGPPDARAERVAAPLGKPRAANKVLTWFGRAATTGQRMRVEIMNFDDVRDIFPKMAEAAIVIRYEGAAPAFTYVTPIELIGLF